MEAQTERVVIQWEVEVWWGTMGFGMNDIMKMFKGVCGLEDPPSRPITWANLDNPISRWRGVGAPGSAVHGFMTASR